VLAAGPRVAVAVESDAFTALPAGPDGRDPFMAQRRETLAGRRPTEIRRHASRSSLSMGNCRPP